jgi:hypothetical protein
MAARQSVSAQSSRSGSLFLLPIVTVAVNKLLNLQKFSFGQASDVDVRQRHLATDSL